MRSTTPPLAAWIARALALALGLASAASALAAQESGVELVGPAGDLHVPEWWTLADATGREAAKVKNSWGSVAVAPGEYDLTMLPQGYEAVPIRWGRVVVPEAGKARIEVLSGIELVGRNEREESPKYWDVLDKATGAKVAHTYQRWGFTPLPPGEYDVRFLPRDYEAVPLSWARVTVQAGQAAKLELHSGIELSGRSEGDETPKYWDVFDKSTGAKVAHAYQRFGFTQLPPGAYSVRVLPRGYEAIEIPIADVTVAAGQAVKLELNAGVEVVGRSAEEESLQAWDVLDKATGKRVAHTHQRWGFTPLPPGDYTITVQPRGYEAITLPWADVAVRPGQTIKVEVNSGVEVVGRGEGDEPFQAWDVLDKATGKRVAHTHQRWGFTPLLPGDYAVRLQPRAWPAVEIPWSDVKVGPASVASLRVLSGIRVEGRPGEEPPAKWFVYDAEGRQVALVERRWGFTPLLPGTYKVLGVPLRGWPPVEVKPDEVVTLGETDLAVRIARVSGAGRSREQERDPAAHRKLMEDVERAIRRAASWLKAQDPVTSMDPAKDRETATLALLALVHAGELERDPELARRGLDYLLRRPLNTFKGTYATSLTAMALRDLAALRYRVRTHECATWLVENQGWGDASQGWGYGDPVPEVGKAKPAGGASGRPRGTAPPTLEVVRRGLVSAPTPGWDNSNVQFAVLGLHAAAQSRIAIPKESWERVDQHFRKAQHADGSWGYYDATTGVGTGSMTCAGVASLLVARHHLKAERPALDPAVVSGLEWLEWRFTVEENPGSRSDHYYFLYGLERVGVLASTEFLGAKEWYLVGARHLLRDQSPNGSWASSKGPATGNSSGVLDTCYAILFLRRATLPLESELPALLGVTYDAGTLPKDLSPAIELILDSSGSMKELVDGKPKIEIARAVVTEVLDGLASDVQVGLRLYGHLHVWVMRREDPRAGPLDPNDPRVKSDTQLVVPIGPLDDERRAKIRKWVASTQPIGWTPMVHSLLQARNDFPPGGKASRTVVLVSDGEETGGGKIEDVAAAYREAGIDVKIHVVGFDIAGTDTQRQLEALARIGKGRYFGARNARELSAALRSAVQGLAFEVHDAAGQTLVARGSLNGEPVELKPGSYRVRLAGVEAEPVSITVAEGQEVTLKLLSSGKLVPGGP